MISEEAVYPCLAKYPNFLPERGAAAATRENPMILQDRLDALKADFEGGKFPLKPTKTCSKSCTAARPS